MALRFWLTLATVAPMLWAARADADPVADFYRGRTVSIVVATNAAGVYDIQARILARHLVDHLPGRPNIVVRAMPGGGGLVGANWIYNVGEKDGTIIGSLLSINPFAQIFGSEGLRYDARKFSYLGSSDPDVGFLTLWHTAPVNSVDDLRKTEITVGASAPRSTPTFFARLQNEVLKARLKVVTGYPGQAEAFLAMENGEINGYPSVFYSSLMSFKPQWVRDKTVKLIVQFGSRPRRELPEVPSLLDIVKDPEDLALAQTAVALTDIGRPYVLAPGVPAERVRAMKDAMRATLTDPAFLAEANQAGLLMQSAQGADEVQTIIDRVYNAPPNIMARLKSLQQ